jgi:murein DD-endopeptidase MepM/ murein hydrolase activator NlpD
LALIVPIVALLAAAPGPLRFDPPSPRLGDLGLVYLSNTDARVKKGWVRVFGYEFPLFRVTREELRAVIAIPLDAEPGEHDIEINTGTRSFRGALPVSDREFDSSELKVSNEFTAKKSKALLARLRAEEKAMQALFMPEPGPPKFSGTLSRPVDGQVTAVFGTKRVFNGKTNSVHYGLDLDGQIGDLIRAAQGGRVVMSAMRWASGGTIVIDHGGGLFTAYFHMSKRNKVPGDKVKAGDVIGEVGKTGRVTGPHLHLAVMVRAKYAGGGAAGQTRSLYVDPEPFLGLVF